ncbi:hypothetical protein [Legionella fallonii]|uniref:Nuclease associated modular domain-containing protein n=1 Tax=Legionella fallonii LLAP-10 TaxID=1212491 RepID=A0A098G478_9GAMM|nr:hypothetical protein [Legionella fallonii]CEG57277.1 protein of unknown function [Intron-encoded nuclease 2] [Legionella fallonii LLAP-10]
MPVRPVIQDKAVVADTITYSPIGEAFRPGKPIPTHPMTTVERRDMVARLERTISDLMIEATKTYQANCYKPNTNEVDPDYISRLSTNEFFFYAKEPLTLKEFEELQNKIAEQAKKQPVGVQLILGSFAVKTYDNKVMNVTPHITCGQSPNFNFIVKNNTSSIDVRYKIPNGQGNNTLLEVFDRNHYNPIIPMPQIMVNGYSRELTFNNIVPCRTPGGTQFLTAVDICLDHTLGVAKQNLEALAIRFPDIWKQPISHVVVSNWVDLEKSQCIGTVVMHVDPTCSPIKCKEGIAQNVVSRGKLEFGDDPITIYEIDKCLILAKEDEANKDLLINELQKGTSADWQIILSSLPHVPGILNQNFPTPFYQLTIAEEVIASALNSGNQKIFRDAYYALKQAGFSLDTATIQKISKTFPMAQQQAETGLVQQLIATDPQQVMINELQKGTSADWQIILSSLPHVPGILNQNFPTPFYQLTIAEEVIASALNSGNQKIFRDAYYALKQAGFSLDTATIQKISKSFPMAQQQAETGLVQQLIATDPQQVMINELQKGTSADWQIILSSLPHVPGILNQNFPTPFYQLTIAEEVIASALNNGNQKIFHDAYYALKQAGFSLDTATIQKISKTFPMVQQQAETGLVQQLIATDPQQVMINELQKGTSADWQIILSSLPHVPGILNQNFPTPFYQLTIAEQILASALNSGNQKIFRDAYYALKQTGFSLDTATIQKISKTYPTTQQAESGIIRQLIATDPQQVIINELQKGTSADWQIILSSLPHVPGILNQNFPTPFYQLTIAEEVIASALNNGNQKIFHDAYYALKQAGFSLDTATIQKISKTFPMVQQQAETGLVQQLIATDPQQVIINELQKDTSADWQIILSSLPHVPGILNQNFPTPFYQLTIAEQILASALNSGNQKIFRDAYYALKQTGFSLDTATIQKISKTYPTAQQAESGIIRQLIATDPQQVIINQVLTDEAVKTSVDQKKQALEERVKEKLAPEDQSKGAKVMKIKNRLERMKDLTEESINTEEPAPEDPTRKHI